MTAIRSSDGSHLSSELIRRFVELTPESSGDPFAAMLYHVRSLRRSAGTLDLNSLLQHRKIYSVRKIADPHVDAFIEPLGSGFHHGFKLTVNGTKPDVRIRFSIAHEICHTFFYELVPEIKLHPHLQDEMEERLCNVGAAELLLPAAELRKVSSELPPSFSSLDALCSQYSVSSEAMIIQLRNLGIWPCELSFWARDDEGQFTMERFAGWRKANWQWVDLNLLSRVWAKGEGSEEWGRSAVYFEGSNDLSYAKWLYYAARRQGKSIVALWSRRPLGKPSQPLLDAPGGILRPRACGSVALGAELGTGADGRAFAPETSRGIFMRRTRSRRAQGGGEFARAVAGRRRTQPSLPARSYATPPMYRLQ